MLHFKVRSLFCRLLASFYQWRPSCRFSKTKSIIAQLQVSHKMNRARVSTIAVSYRCMTDSWQVWDSQNDCAADERAKHLCIWEPPKLQKTALTMKTTQIVWFRTAFPAVADTVSCHLWCVCAELTGSPAQILPPWSLCRLSMKLFITFFFILTAYLQIHFRCKCLTRMSSTVGWVILDQRLYRKFHTVEKF